MPRYPVVAILSNLIIIFSIPPVTGSQTEFIPQCFHVGAPCGKLLSVAQHPTTGLVYVATEDGLYKLDSNLHIVSYTTTAKITEGVVNSFILLTDSGFVVCRNDESGSCHFRSIGSFDVVNGLYQPGVVSKKCHSGSVVSWIANGPNGVIVVNVAVSSDTDENLPTLSTRYLLSQEQVTANYSKFMSFNWSRLNDPDFCYDLDTSHPLGGKKPILKDALFTTRTVVNAITVQEHKNNETIFFLGDSRGNLVKKRLRDGSWESETTPVFEDGSPVLSPSGLLVDINGDILYIISDTKLVNMSTKFYQNPAARKTPPYQIPTITVISVFIFALLLVVLAAVIFYKRRQKMSWYRTYGR